MSKITRIHDYTDPDFSQVVLNQHGAYKIDTILVSFEIINSDTTKIATQYTQSLEEVIEDFRLYYPFIYKLIMPNRGLLPILL